MGHNSGTDILYMPAVHRGYVDYLSIRTGEVGILDEALVQETPRLDRDIRAMGSELVVSIVRVVVPERHVVRVTPDNLDEFLIRQDASQPIYMPDEDVSHTFAYNYLAPRLISFEPTFLRWDKKASVTASPVLPDRVSTDSHDQAILSEVADPEAEGSRDWWRQIGAVIVSEKGGILLRGRNHPCVAEDYTLETFGDPRSNFDAGQNIDMQKNIHAEAGVIAKAAKDGIKLEGTDLYVTTFPCPTCAKLIASAGIKRVYFRDGYSLLDAMDIFQAKKIEVIQVIDKLPNAG